MEKIVQEIIDKLRKSGISERQAAKMAGLQQVKVNRMLKGETKKIDFEEITKLRNALNIVSEPEAPYSKELFQLKISPETQALVDKMQHLDKTAKIMMSEVIAKMEGMTQMEQWQAVAGMMQKLSEGDNNPPSNKQSS